MGWRMLSAMLIMSAVLVMFAALVMSAVLVLSTIVVMSAFLGMAVLRPKKRDVLLRIDPTNERRGRLILKLFCSGTRSGTRSGRMSKSKLDMAVARRLPGRSAGEDILGSGRRALSGRAISNDVNSRPHRLPAKR